MNNKKLIETLAKYDFISTTEVEIDGKTYNQYELDEQANTQILLGIYLKLQKILNIITTLIVLGVLGAILLIIGMIK